MKVEGFRNGVSVGIWDSAWLASLATGIPQSKVRAILAGTVKSGKGVVFKWRSLK